MISFELPAGEGVVIIEPSGPLREEDFEALAARVDEHLEREGVLEGLLIHARSFPGWESFGAFLSHVRFVRDHHRQIRRVAIAADGAIPALAPILAGHFVSAEIRHFAYSELDSAKKWAANG
jgi:hypothetical protein